MMSEGNKGDRMTMGYEKTIKCSMCSHEAQFCIGLGIKRKSYCPKHYALIISRRLKPKVKA